MQKGQLEFRKNEVAEVKYEIGPDGWGRITPAIGHPHWHPLSIQAEPCTLVKHDGDTLKVRLLSADGLIQVVE